MTPSIRIRYFSKSNAKEGIMSDPNNVQKRNRRDRIPRIHIGGMKFVVAGAVTTTTHQLGNLAIGG